MQGEPRVLYKGCLPLGSQVTWSWDPSEATIIRHLMGLPHQARPGIRDTCPARAARGATESSTRAPSGHRETGGRLTSTPGGHAPQNCAALRACDAAEHAVDACAAAG